MNMKKENTSPLNTSFINQRIKELDLKQVWLASKIGVDKITINRWTSGKVKRIASHNAKLLAQYLQCTVNDIILKNDIIAAGTNVEKESAIENILSDDLIAILSPFEKWDLAESIIKASIHPNIEPLKIAQLYNHLWCVNLNKNNFDQAIYFAYKALSISKRYVNKRMFVLSLFNIATAHVLNGNYNSSMSVYDYCVHNIEHLASQKEQAAIYNNLATLHQYYCNFNTSIDSFSKSVSLLAKEANYFKLCLTFIGIGDLYIEIGNIEEALSALSKAYDYAVKSNYRTGTIRSTFYKVDAFIVSRQLDEAVNMMKYDLNTLVENNIKDLHCYEILARYHRHLGNFNKALEIIQSGLNTCCSHPLEEARMLQEEARLALVMMNSKDESAFRKKANRLFKSGRLYDRIWNTTIAEYGHMYSINDKSWLLK